MNKFIVPFAVVCTLAAGVIARAQSNYEPYVFTTLAGNHPGHVDGIGSAARFDYPGDSCVDSAGNFYVADAHNDTIRKITPAGVVSTFAGLANNIGSSDGTGSTARFYNPQDVAVDSADNIYVADGGNNTIRKITPGGVVTTVAGMAGSAGSTDGTGSAARFYAPSGVAVDSAGNIYVADSNNHTIRKIAPGGVVSTLAGSAGIIGSEDGSGASFYRPSRLVVNHAGKIVVADTYNSTIREVTSTGAVTTLAGTSGSCGSSDGISAQFCLPRGVSVDDADNIYVADTSNNTIRKIAPNGYVSTLAGSLIRGSADGAGNAAQFDRPVGTSVDNEGNVFVADSYNHTVRKVTPAGVVNTFAGLASPGNDDGTGAAARFWFPQGVAVSSAGDVYVADVSNNIIRKITPAGVVNTLAGLAGNSGSVDGTGSAARFDFPRGVAMDSAANVYVADSHNHTIRKISPAGVVNTFAGLAGSSGSADGTGSAARFNEPFGVAIDSANNVYVAEYYNNTIRKITPAAVVSTLAGSAGLFGSADGNGSTARFAYPESVAVDNAGNVYVADSDNHTIRKITAAGLVSTLAGSPRVSGSADGIGAAARFYYPTGVAVDSAGNVYVGDTVNNTIRKVTPTGVVTTLGGSPPHYAWADGTGSAARLDSPGGVAVSSAGKLYVADTYNHSIRVAIPQLRLVGAVSRKTHGTAGTFDINLPLTGTPGIECRSTGGNHTLVFTFDNNMMSGNASVISGGGNVSGSPTFSEKTMTVNLTGVADVQQITLELSSVSDAFAQVLPDTTVSVNILAGDTSGNKTVNSTDVSQTKLQSGAPVSAANFREDVVVSGSINASDISLVKSRAGFGVP